MPVPPAQMREYERLLAQEFESESGKFEDSVNNGCITDIVITGEVRASTCSNLFIFAIQMRAPFIMGVWCIVQLLSGSCSVPSRHSVDRFSFLPPCFWLTMVLFVPSVDGLCSLPPLGLLQIHWPCTRS